MDSINPTFKVPMAPVPPLSSQVESLLFNDIVEENSVALRNNMMEFLQVYPYKKYEVEFANFLKRTKSMILEGQRAGANVSRLTNSSQIHTRPSSSFHYRQSSGMSMITSHRHSTFRAPENSFQPVESLNPFKPPGNNYLQPRVVLPRCLEQSNNVSNQSSSSSVAATVIEVSHTGGININSNNNRQHSQLPELSERSESLVPPLNGYSDVTMNENDFAFSLRQNNNTDNDNNSVEKLLDGAGFKINLGLPENNKTTNNTVNQDNNQLRTVEIVEKFLSKWSVRAKQIKCPKQRSSKVIVLLTGTLLQENRITIIEQFHDAGVLESRRSNDLVRTTKGFYRLVGNIIGGSPNELYQACRALNGIPRSWKKNSDDWCGVKKSIKNKAVISLELESPAGPVKHVKPKSYSDVNKSFTRNGIAYNDKNVMSSPQIIKGKRKFTGNDEFERKSKQHKFNEAASLIASTPKRPVKPCVYESPSQMLKRKIQNKTAIARLTSSMLNDSIGVTKKRSFHKEQSNEFLKQKSPVSSLLKINHKPSDQVSTVSSTRNLNSTKQSKRKSADNSIVLNRINNNLGHSSKESADNYVTATLNSNESSVTTTKSSCNNSKKPTPSIKDKSTRTVKQKENKRAKEVQKKTNSKVPAGNKKKSNEFTIKKKHSPQRSLLPAEQGLFSIADGSFSDTDFSMRSFGKMSNLSSRGDKSRSETPPLCHQQWPSTSPSKSSAYSNPPTPLSKSIDAKVLKRVKAPKIYLEEELKNEKKIKKNTASDFKTVSNKIDKIFQSVGCDE